MAGSSRLRALSWIARHSLSVRANTPGGSNCCRLSRTRATSTVAHPRRSAISRDVGMQVAGFVELVDQVLGDQKVGGAVDAEGEPAR